MSDERSITRRRYLAGSAVAGAAGLAGCLDSSGPLEVTDTKMLKRLFGFKVIAFATVANTAEEPHGGTLVLKLSHTEAIGTVKEPLEVAIPGSGERRYRHEFELQFDEGLPEDGHYELDTNLKDVDPVDSVPTHTSPEPY